MYKDVGQVIKKIIALDGIDILKDSKRFIALFDDFAPDLVEERKVFHRGVNDSILGDIFNFYHLESEAKPNMIKKLYQSMQVDFGLSHEWINIILGSFSEAFGVYDIYDAELLIQHHTTDDINDEVSVDDVVKAEEMTADSSDVTKEIELQNGGLYVGQAIAGKPHGYGKCMYKDGSSYIGEWEFGLYCGKGKLVTATGNEYEGMFKDDKYHGEGTLLYSNGKMCKGEWNKGHLWTGTGYIKYSDGTSYEGEINKGKRHGQGVAYYQNGKTCSGEWRDGNLLNGHGHIKYTDATYDGEIKNGKRHGQGKLLYFNGRLEDGTWENGKFMDVGFVEILLKRSLSPLSVADGSTYMIKFDKFDPIKIVSTKKDVIKNVEIPCGEYNVSLELYGYEDTSCKKPLDFIKEQKLVIKRNETTRIKIIPSKFLGSPKMSIENS